VFSRVPEKAKITLDYIKDRRFMGGCLKGTQHAPDRQTLRLASRQSARDHGVSRFPAAARGIRVRPCSARGSHHAYHHPVANQTLIVQPRGKDAKPYQVGQFLAMVEAFDLTLEE
jgi:hypothetical protein